MHWAPTFYTDGHCFSISGAVSMYVKNALSSAVRVYIGWVYKAQLACVSNPDVVFAVVSRQPSMLNFESSCAQPRVGTDEAR